MFKTFLNSKFKFSNEFFQTLGNNFSGNFNSASIGNLMINFPNYAKLQGDATKSKIQQQNDKSKRNLELISQREKEIAHDKHWELQKNDSNNTSEIITEFVFEDESTALEFISLVKEKCDELDHHPSWTYKANQLTKTYVLKINLTSHFAANNVTDKDYELAAFLTYEYEKAKTFYFNSKLRGVICTTATIAFAFFIYNYSLRRYKKATFQYNYLEIPQ